MRRTLRLRLPALHAAQAKIEASTARFRIVVAGRRFGKTRFGVRECVKVASSGGRAWWIAPSYKLARPGWRALLRLVKKYPGISINKSERLIEFPGGGEIQVRTGKDPDELRGEGLHLVVLDEAAYMKREVWFEAIRPALADEKGDALFISTPAGMSNWLAELWDAAQDDPDWQTFRFTTADNPFIDADEIDAMRKDLGSLLARQEIDAEFLDEIGTIFRPEWFSFFRKWRIADSDGTERLYYRAGDETVADSDCSHFITVDLALKTKQQNDYTVLVAWAITPRGKRLVVDVVRFKAEAPDIIPISERLVAKWTAAWIGFESTAYQAAMTQFGRRAGLPAIELSVDGDKVARAMPLAAFIEDERVFFDNEADHWEELKREMLVFPNGEHDDQVDALAYGVAGQTQKAAWVAR